MDFSTFENRYIITGKLVVQNALHIGSGKEEEGLDSPFIRDIENGNFYIPGSSFRGYLSTKLERLLNSENNFKLIEKENQEELNEGDVKLIFGYTNLEKEENKKIVERVKVKSGLDSDSMAGKIHIADMPIISDVESIRRDGIKIDRETGATEDGAKFDYNIVPAGSEFAFKIELNNVEDYQLELIGLALKDIVEEGDLFGGMLSRGIRKCKIEKSTLSVKYVDSKEKNSLKNYIFKKEMKNKKIDEIFDIKHLDLKLR